MNRSALCENVRAVVRVPEPETEAAQRKVVGTRHFGEPPSTENRASTRDGFVKLRIS